MIFNLLQGRAIANLSLLFLFLLWLALFAWRKTFSYLTFGGLYVIEVVVVLGLWLFLHSVLARSRLSFSVPRDAAIQRALWLAGIFVAYNIARAALSPDINPKGLIPGVYPAYFAIALVIATNADAGVVRFVSRALVAMFFLTPAVMYLNNYVIIPRFGVIEDPGATYVYGVAMVLALVLVRKRLLSFALFGLYFTFSVLLFERGTFVNAALAALTLFLAASRETRGALARLLFGRGVLFVVLLVLMAPVVVAMFFDLERVRFLVTSGNLLTFFWSIFGAGADFGLEGTRQHRLDMWLAIIRMVFSGPWSMLFGFGYEGEVGDALGISFRAPHNGFMTILFRGGIVGLSLYALFLHGLFDVLRRTIRSAEAGAAAHREATVGLVILGALIGDTLTGTILDSPFTSWLFYMQIAIICVLAYRLRQGESLPGGVAAVSAARPLEAPASP